METIPEVELIAAAVLGYVLQWARAPKVLPMWASWLGVAVTSAALWFWMTPNGISAFQSDWRRALVSIVMFGMAAAGASRIARDAKTAPGTNSI